MRKAITIMITIIIIIIIIVIIGSKKIGVDVAEDEANHE